MYFETHCHLNDKQFNEDLNICIENALDNGCVGFNIVGWDFESSKRALEIASANKEMIVSVGLHPSNCLEAPKDELANIVELIGADTDKKIKAIGEIGLDYYWDKDEEHHRIQRQFFEKQIQRVFRNCVCFVSQLHIHERVCKMCYFLDLVIPLHSSQLNQLFSIVYKRSPNYLDEQFLVFQ